MGRKKIVIRRIADTRTRAATFKKRRQGLLKKAAELAVLCDCQIAVFICSENDYRTQYSSVANPNDLLVKFGDASQIEENLRDVDFAHILNYPDAEEDGDKAAADGSGKRAEDDDDVFFIPPAPAATRQQPTTNQQAQANAMAQQYVTLGSPELAQRIQPQVYPKPEQGAFQSPVDANGTTWVFPQQTSGYSTAQQYAAAGQPIPPQAMTGTALQHYGRRPRMLELYRNSNLAQAIIAKQDLSPQTQSNPVLSPGAYQQLSTENMQRVASQSHPVMVSVDELEQFDRSADVQPPPGEMPNTLRSFRSMPSNAVPPGSRLGALIDEKGDGYYGAAMGTRPPQAVQLPTEHRQFTSMFAQQPIHEFSSGGQAISQMAVAPSHLQPQQVAMQVSHHPQQAVAMGPATTSNVSIGSSIIPSSNGSQPHTQGGLSFAAPGQAQPAGTGTPPTAADRGVMNLIAATALTRDTMDEGQ